MTDLPLHKVAQISDYGIFLKAIIATSIEDTVMYSHRDDYYIFGLIDEGECSLCIDFKEYRISKGGTIFIQPGQVHPLLVLSIPCRLLKLLLCRKNK